MRKVAAMKLLRLIVLAGLLAVPAVAAEGPDDQYVRIFQTIQEGDRLAQSGQDRAALAKYVAALESLKRFKVLYPAWNERVIGYRLEYLDSKIHPNPRANPLPAPPETNATAPRTNSTATTPPATAALAAAQATLLQDEVDRLRAENTRLNAKLREALSVQPAVADPRDIARAEDRARHLEKETDLLRVRLKLATNAAAARPDLEKSVEELRRSVAEQAGIAATLRAENETLKMRRAEAPPPAESAADLRARLATQSDAAAVLRAEIDHLKAREQSTAKRQEDAARDWKKKLAAESDALEKLRAEHEALLKREKERAGKRTSSDQEAADLKKKLDAQTAKLAALQSENDRLKKRQPPAAPPPAIAPAEMPPDAARELETLRARLAVLEARPLPYTRDELALLSKPPPKPPPAESLTVSTTTPAATGPVKKSRREIPAGAGPLVAAAERAFAQRNYPEAERRYLEVLRQDEGNIGTLASLAATQLEMNRLADAEKNVRKALVIEPDDGISLYVLGRILYLQEKTDESLDALSRSAKANPNHADTQNYLGIVLSEKGQRVPAEAAFRRALDLQPGHPTAHNNLAVVYATQTPPAIALARWHYERALATGHPKNPDLEKLLKEKP
jgi:tetratricopeptide (TPR) repeat protein